MIACSFDVTAAMEPGVPAGKSLRRSREFDGDDHAQTVIMGDHLTKLEIIVAPSNPSQDQLQSILNAGQNSSKAPI
jgi:hypothetical protein